MNEISIEKQDINKEIPNNQEILKNFLESNYRHSKALYRVAKNHIKTFLKFYISKVKSIEGIDSIKDINMKSIIMIKKRDIIDYFNFVNNREDHVLKYKKLEFHYPRVFIKHVLDYYGDEFSSLEEQIRVMRLIIYISDTKSFNWNPVFEHKQSECTFKDVVLNKEEISKILFYVKRKNFQKYLMLRILVETGMRKIELISINLKNKVKGKIISLFDDLINRILRVKGKTGHKVYHVTKELTQLILYFLEDRKHFDVNDEFGEPLFISRHNRRFALLTFTHFLSKHRELMGFKKHIVTSTFRKTINTLRKKMGCSLEDRKILLNHGTGDVNSDFYIKYENGDYLNIYDRWNPYKNIQL